MSGFITREWVPPLAKSDETSMRTYLDGHPAAHFRQSLEWLTAHGPGNLRVFVTNAGGRIVAASLVERTPSRLRFVATAQIARGPLFDSNDALDAHLDAVRQALAGWATCLRIAPFVTPSSLNLRGEWRQVASSPLYESTLIVAIQASEEEQWRMLRRSTRTSINRAGQAGLQVEAVRGDEAFCSFARDYNAFAMQRGLAPLSERVVTALASFASDGKAPGRCLLLQAVHGQQSLGAALFILNGRSLAYEWGWTGAAHGHSRLPILHPILWRAIAFCRSTGIPELDLGGYLPERGNDDPINHLKLGFSKTARHFAPERRLVLAPVRQAVGDAISRVRRRLDC